jgi:hypothetical protein
LFQNPVGFGQALGKPAKSPVFPLNPEKLFQKLKFWNSLDIIMDLFDNPVGYLTSPAIFQAKARL